MLPGGTIDPADERFHNAPGRVRYDFTWARPGHRARVTFDLGRVTGDAIARRFGADGLMVEYEGRNQAGEFVAVLRAGDEEWVGEDFMRASIRRFTEAVREGDPGRVLVSGEAALRHLREQVGVCQRTWGQGSASRAGKSGDPR
jgi:hypothetical protein